ncbi:Protein ALTERED PHOSPHATE STARVATION RESPONSE 1 [Linum perenne]
MGCFYSRIEREKMVSRCKARKKYKKQLVQARQFMSTSHLMYLRALRSTGSALIHFSNIETNLRHHHHLLPPAISSPSPSLPPVSANRNIYDFSSSCCVHKVAYGFVECLILLSYNKWLWILFRQLMSFYFD